jgi:hypothetical protein
MSDPTQPQKEAPVFRRPIREIIADLSKPIPDRFLKTKPVKNQQLTFIPWYHAVRLLDWYAPGWCYEVRSVTPISEQTVLTVRLIIPAAEGDLWREATGIEEDEVTGYGDTSSNAESMALRRAAAKFGLGLYLYDRGKEMNR